MKSCCFIGHRNVQPTNELICDINLTIENLISCFGVSAFLFGSASNFDELCLKIVNDFKKIYPDITLIYVRSHYPYLTPEYNDYLLQSYDKTIMPSSIENSGRASYVKRNQFMINESDFCVFYYNQNYAPPQKKYHKRALTTYQPKSGTKLAYDYAVKKKKQVINLYK